MSIHEMMARFTNNVMKENSTSNITYNQTTNKRTTDLIRYQHKSNDTIIHNHTPDYPQDISWDNSMPTDTGESNDPIIDSYMADYPQDIGWDSSIPVDTGESNDTIMDSHITDYSQDIDWGSTPDDMGIGARPAFLDPVDVNFDDEVGNSSTVSFNDPSSDVNPTG